MLGPHGLIAGRAERNEVLERCGTSFRLCETVTCLKIRYINDIATPRGRTLCLEILTSV